MLFINTIHIESGMCSWCPNTSRASVDGVCVCAMCRLISDIHRKPLLTNQTYFYQFKMHKFCECVLTTAIYGPSRGGIRIPQKHLACHRISVILGNIVSFQYFALPIPHHGYFISARFLFSNFPIFWCVSFLCRSLPLPWAFVSIPSVPCFLIWKNKYFLPENDILTFSGLFRTECLLS